MKQDRNADFKTIEGFGDEWERFDQTELSEEEHNEIFNKYFSIFPWDVLPEEAVGFDLGCGSGRWAKIVAPRVGSLHCIDPSTALEVARKSLSAHDNCKFHSATVDEMPLGDATMDFGYSLGVLHHVPDTRAGIKACVDKLKPGAPFLLYLYYAFDNRPMWFRLLWRISDIFRSLVSRLPHGPRYLCCQVIALMVYLPFAKLARVGEKLGFNVSHYPLSFYRNSSFYTMRTDALDRFGTRLEHRFSRASIKEMMEYAGLERVSFSTREPFWCAVGYKKFPDKGDS